MRPSYQIINLDKQEYYLPWTFKEIDFGSLVCGKKMSLTALALLLVDRLTDIACSHPIVGSWAGDRIVIVEKYSEHSKYFSLEEQVRQKLLTDGEKINLYDRESYKDITKQLVEAMLEEERLVSQLEFVTLHLHGFSEEAVKREKEMNEKKEKNNGTIL